MTTLIGRIKGRLTPPIRRRQEVETERIRIKTTEKPCLYQYIPLNEGCSSCVYPLKGDFPTVCDCSHHVLSTPENIIVYMKESVLKKDVERIKLLYNVYKSGFGHDYRLEEFERWYNSQRSGL